jgi:hypothetical protein
MLLPKEVADTILVMDLEQVHEKIDEKNKAIIFFLKQQGNNSFVPVTTILYTKNFL